MYAEAENGWKYFGCSQEFEWVRAGPIWARGDAGTNRDGRVNGLPFTPPARHNTNVPIHLVSLGMRALVSPFARGHQQVLKTYTRSAAPASFAINEPRVAWLPYCLHYNIRRSLSLEQQRKLHVDNAIPTEPTIYALSTASGKAAIAVIRISGAACKQVRRIAYYFAPQALTIAQIYQGFCPVAPLPKPRYAALRKLYTPHVPPSPETLLDSGALVLYFPAPHTVTGEDVLEFHVHGGPAIVRAVLAAIPACAPQEKDVTTTVSQVRYAEPGEFTRRAFANDRMDLPQIEALGETLSAATEQQRRLSVRGTTSALAARYEYWRKLLLLARGELEALIDFSEDQHFDESPASLCASVAEQVRNLRGQMAIHCENAVRGELLRNGITVALLGAPNAGKSSLLNRIVGRDAAIVSQEAGTTRDVVEVGLDLGGWLVKIGDMAGLRKATSKSVIVGAVEKEGIRRAKARALDSDVLVVVQDATAKMDPEVMETTKQCVDLGISTIVAVNKCDQLPSPKAAEKSWISKIQDNLGVPADDVSFISCKDESSPNAGNLQSFLDTLLQVFQDMTTALVPDQDPDPSIWQESLGATERQRVLLTECSAHLDIFLSTVTTTSTESGDDIDIVVAAEALRAAADTLSRITGRGDSGDVEEVLGVVFEK